MTTAAIDLKTDGSDPLARAAGFRLGSRLPLQVMMAALDKPIGT